MNESDRSKWMETAREGVNQRGLDELANSKRAHYEYPGGPLFGNVAEDIDEDEEEEEEIADEGEGESIEEDGEMETESQERESIDEQVRIKLIEN